tara:strand:+ start:1643 stop:3289 length:1647 start_codon:yes stop_codon:yes gene_type:complete
MVRQASIMLGRMLGGEETEIGRRLLQGGGLSPDEARFIRQRVESTQRATSPTEIGRKVKESGGLTMGQRSVPTRADLGAAPEPEFPVPAGSPAIRRLQQLRREIGPMQGPRESTSADYIFQPAIRGMRNPQGSVAPGTMFSRTGKVTEPGTKIGGRMMEGSYPSTPRRAVVRETEVEVSPGQGELPLDFRSNREVMSEFDPMTAPGMGGRRPAEGIVTEFDPSALVRSPGGGLTSNDIARMRAQQDPFRPQGVQMVDLNDIEFTMDPRQARNVGLVGAGGLAVGIGEILRNRINNAAAPEGGMPPTGEMYGPPNQAPDAGDYMGGGGALPPGDGLVEPTTLTPEESGALATDIENKITAIQQSDPVSAQVVRAMAPKSPEQYSNIGDYYADRAAFVRSLQQGGSFSDVVDAIKSTAANEEMAGNLEAFARANPQMAYENMLRQGLINREGQLVSPEMNQQSQSVTSQTYGSSLGTNNEANALGQANAAASQMYTGDFNNDLEAAAAIQKNNELIAAAAPIEYGNLQRPDQFLGQQMAMRMAGRMGGMN